MLMKSKVRRGNTVTSSVAWPTSMESDRTEKLAMTGSADGCSILPENKFVWTRLRVDTSRVLSVGGLHPLRELPERGRRLTSNRLEGLHS